MRRSEHASTSIDGPGRREAARRAVWRRACLAALAIGLAGTLASACRTGPAEQASQPLRQEVARLQRSVTLLQRQIELAAGKDFYLVLDPAVPDLTLMLSGAELQRFPVLGLQVGRPRVAWARRSDPRPWQGVVWVKGELDPPRQLDRLVIQAAEPGKSAGEPETPPIPPTPEELYPVPSRYHVRFSGGLSIEVRPREADVEAGRLARLRAWWSAKWVDVAAALGSRDRDALRLRLVLKPRDAESLYRSLPPAVRLLVLSGGASATPAASPSSQSATPPPGR